MNIKLFLSVFICMAICQINGMKLPDESSISVNEKSQQLTSKLKRILENLKTRTRRGSDVSKLSEDITEKIGSICKDALGAVEEINELNKKFEKNQKETMIKIGNYFDNEKNKILDDKRKNNNDAIINKSDRIDNDRERKALKDERNKLETDKIDFEEHQKSKCTELGFITCTPPIVDPKAKKMKIGFDFSFNMEGDKKDFAAHVTPTKDGITEE